MTAILDVPRRAADWRAAPLSSAWGRYIERAVYHRNKSREAGMSDQRRRFHREEMRFWARLALIS